MASNPAIETEGPIAWILGPKGARKKRTMQVWSENYDRGQATELEAGVETKRVWKVQGLLGLGPKAGACHGAIHARQTPGRPESGHRWASQAAELREISDGQPCRSASEKRPALGAGASNFAQQAGGRRRSQP